MYNSTDFEEDGYRKIERRKLANQTVVQDRKNNRPIMIIEGVVVLPIGAAINLINPNVDAIVVSVRLLPQSENSLIEVAVCLEVEVPEEYYGPEGA